MYSGRVDVLPSTLREYVFTDINRTQSFQFVSGTNEGYNEVWWQYCSANSTVIDRYVIYNYKDQVWYFGDWTNYNGAYQGRTAWLDSPLRSSPMAVAYGSAGGSDNGLLVYHEDGVDDGTVNPSVPIVANVQSSDFDIGDGDKFSAVNRVVPDIDFIGSTTTTPAVTMTVSTRNFPGQGAFNNDTPTNISGSMVTTQVYDYTNQVFVRLRGRQVAFRVGSEGAGIKWQLGVPRLDIQSDGTRT
jgi:hypothetical protein